MTIARRRTVRIRVGAVLLALATVQFFAAHVIAQRAWPTPYSWTTNYISDLGAVTCAPGSSGVCSPLHAVMNTAFLLQGALLIGGTVLTTEAWTASTGRRVLAGPGRRRRRVVDGRRARTGGRGPCGSRCGCAAGLRREQRRAPGRRCVGVHTAASFVPPRRDGARHRRGGRVRTAGRCDDVAGRSRRCRCGGTRRGVPAPDLGARHRRRAPGGRSPTCVRPTADVMSTAVGSVVRVCRFPLVTRTLIQVPFPADELSISGFELKANGASSSGLVPSRRRGPAATPRAP